MKKMIFNLVFVMSLLTIQATYSQNLVKYQLNGKIGFKNQSGKVVLPAKYDLVESFKDGIASVKIGNKYGIISRLGKEVIPVKYDRIASFNEGIATVQIGDKYGAINRLGKEIIPVRYEHIGKCSEGLISYNFEDESGKYENGYFNKTGEVEFSYNPVEGTFMTCGDFSEGIAIIEVTAVITEYAWKSIYYGINEQGDKVVDFDEDINTLKPFSEGYAAAQFYNNGSPKWGYVNKRGELVIDMKWDDAESFKDGKAKVAINEEVPSTYYDEEYDEVEEGYIHENVYYYINKNGYVLGKAKE